MKKKNFEYKTRLNAITIYMIVVSICLGTLYYIYTLKNNISEQKNDIEKYKTNFSLTNEFIYAVNQAQSMGNMYISTKDSIYFLKFNQSLNKLSSLSDSIINYQEPDFEKNIFDSIYILLQKKGVIINSLSAKFRFFHPVYLKDKDAQNNDAINIKSAKDTIILSPERRNLWARINNVFFPSNDRVKTKIISHDPDTLKVVKIDSDKNFMVAINSLAAQASLKYTEHLSKIEKDITKLISADYDISLQISEMLIKLHRQMIDSSMNEIKNNEEFIRKNYIYSITSGVLSLGLILIFIILIIRNSNKSYALRKALEAANAQTTAIMESRHQLLLSVSHDVKTPLNAILGYLELWNTKEHNISTKEMHAVRNSGKHIELLFENVLEFSKIEQGKIGINYSNFNINKLYDEAVEMFEPLVLQKKLSFIHHTSIDNDVVLHSDYLKIKQIISNILSNAIKYTVHGDIHFNIEYSDNTLFIEITDTGVGIPQHKIDDIFIAFTRVEENNMVANGSGFGMFIVKTFVDVLQGNISILSVVGKGTTACISIPAQSIALTIKDTPCSILIIDDDIPFLTMLKEMLTLMGHRVEACSSLEELEILLKQQQYDFLLTDMEMGTFCGVDVLKTVKRKAFTMPIIVISGKSDFDKEQTTALGFDGYLQKPVTMESLQQFFYNAHVGMHTEEIHELLNVDKETAKKIWKLFMASVIENITVLQQTLEEKSFTKAKAICHKMLPMFMQLQFNDAAKILQKIDRAQKDDFLWQDDITALIKICEQIIHEENVNV